MKRTGYTCVRVSFCLLSGLLWLLGCGVVGVAIWLRVAYGGYISLVPQYEYLSFDAVLLIVGLLIFATAFFGCCGAWCKNRCLLISYFVLVAVLCILELTAGVLGFVYRQMVNDTLRQELLGGIREHYSASNDSSGLVLAWGHVQEQLECCGVQKYDDWFNISSWPGRDYVPDSCCFPQHRNITDCGKRGHPALWYPDGCYGKLQTWFLDRLYLVGIVGLGVAFIQLFGLTSSMVLFCAVRHKVKYQRSVTLKTSKPI